MLAAVALTLLLAAVDAPGAPDFDTLSDQLERSLAQAGAGGQAGERIELHRSAPDGWDMSIIAAWDGAAWRLLALRLHHRERIETPSPAWLERHQALLADLRPDQLRRLEPAELFEVPEPDFLPILPEEIRSRQFEFRGYWYRASWFNAGGPDEFARWALRSFELVAQPDRDQ